MSMVSRQELALNIDMAEWGWLRAHLGRGGLILVSSDLDLAEAGTRVAADDSAAINGWVNEGKLTKPTLVQIEQWDAQKEKKFQMLIVSPYILIQDKTLTIQ